MMQHTGWDELIEEFCALGGVADNVVLRDDGPLGRGLFAADPSRPVQIAVPENLLIDVESIQIDNGTFRIKPEAGVPARERAFFEFYQNELCWEGGGRDECEAYFARLDRLPENIRAFLREELHFQSRSPSAISLERIQARFMRSRQINYKERDRIMPVLDLANHRTDGCAFKFDNGISIAGIYANEVYVHYGLEDPWGAFQSWGFASAEPVAFSTPALVGVEGQKLDIGRNVSTSTTRGNFRVPVVKKDGQKTNISFLMLGHANFPRASKGIFYQLMKDIGQPYAEGLFDEIRRFNIQKFLKLLELLDDEDAPLATTLRQVCRYQIGALTHAIGTRDIGG